MVIKSTCSNPGTYRGSGQLPRGGGGSSKMREKGKADTKFNAQFYVNGPLFQKSCTAQYLIQTFDNVQLLEIMPLILYKGNVNVTFT